MRASHDHQRTAGRRARVSPVLAAGSAPHSVVDHKSQMGRSTRLRNSSMRGHLHSTAPTCRGLHCATAFSIRVRSLRHHRSLSVRRHVCILPNGRAATHSYAARGGRIGELRYAARLSAKFVRAVMAARSQLRTPKHIDCQVTYRSECHFVQRLSAFVGFNTDEHSERHHGTVLYKPRNLHEQQGARQHECR